MINWNSFNKRIGRMHERSLSLIANDYKLLFYDFLFRFNREKPSFKHSRNIQRYINDLLTKVYKCLDGRSLELMNDVFYFHRNHYNFLF